MTNSIKIILLLVFFLRVADLSAHQQDTILITAANLGIKDLKKGKSTYIVYNKKIKESAAERITLVQINVESKMYKEKPVIAITQQWDRDTVIHSAYTLLSTTDFSTILHEYYWKRLGYSAKFDFESRKVSFEGIVPDSIRVKAEADFKESFDKYNLNWHSDLVIFPLLPYKENRVFKINFYDPGFGKVDENFYVVKGSDIITGSAGEKISCWVLQLTFTSSPGYQKFWIDKKNRELLKEEDSFNNGYRYKLKMKVSEDN